jgi:alcohol dehydrogenase class IV
MSNAFSPFSIARLPRIEFGSGALDKLPDIAAGYGRHLLFVTGARSFVESAAGTQLFAALRARKLSWEQVRVSDEPSPAFVDATVAALRPNSLTPWSASAAAAPSMRPSDCRAAAAG